MLDQTKSDEKKFQQLLSQALAEFQAINKAVETGQKVGEVKKGDPIALVGNTGYPNCSTGPHLHFEVRRDGQWIDPGGFVGSSWMWPLSDPIVITQGYGVTPWSWRYSYSGGIHTGYDMVSNSSDVIRAVADGTLYSSSQNCNGPIIKIKYIDHGSGLMSFYLHVQ
ncbi:MAG: putative peptidase [Microgenomates bacterium OLB23]|nr:MAG: putative peptidase [Microgenomates bacterium OLB23]